jgi:2-keto-3-deoxy-L-rhamnonate aldolase RhmA
MQCSSSVNTQQRTCGRHIRGEDSRIHYLSVPGIHAVTLGPADLAQELGVFGTPDQGKVIDEYRLRLIEAAGRHSKDVSMLVSSIEQGEQWILAGAKIICYSGEVEILRRGIMEAATRLHAVRS